jgi:UDP-N-acetylglucosamine--N-acetylmuramyl-(pentapeptide) pyrophosphoryl-undecaprenol N-acetylglucosamine transferase
VSTSEPLSVVLAGGGTAGHVNPLLAVADELRRRDPRTKFLVLGTSTGLEADLVPERGYELRSIPRVPLPRRPSTDLLRLPGRLTHAVRAAEAAIDEIGAGVVVGFGGYVSTPAYLAARRRGVPVVIHEQNARPGLANRLGARWAAAVGTTFPDTSLPEATTVGLPLRTEIAELVVQREQDAAGARARGAAELGLDPALPTVLVTGGSSGALSVNRAVAAAAGDLLAAGLQVLHLTGRDKADSVRAAVDAVRGTHDTSRYHVREYLSQMHHALAAADLVVARSGAGTVCELAALGLPAVYVPLPIGNGEQRLNATGVVGAGGGLVVDDADLTPAWVAQQVPALVGDRTRLAAMADAARGVGVRDAAARMADLVAGAAGAVEGSR